MTHVTLWDGDMNSAVAPLHTDGTAHWVCQSSQKIRDWTSPLFRWAAWLPVYSHSPMDQSAWIEAARFDCLRSLIPVLCGRLFDLTWTLQSRCIFHKQGQGTHAKLVMVIIISWRDSCLMNDLEKGLIQYRMWFTSIFSTFEFLSLEECIHVYSKWI